MAKAQENVSISFRTARTQVKQLDAMAKRQRRDRTQVIEEAIEQYLALQQMHLARIEEGVAAAEAGDFATEEEVQTEFARWRSR